MKRYPPRYKPVFPFVIKTYSKELPVTYYTAQLALQTDCKIAKLERFMHCEGLSFRCQLSVKNYLLIYLKGFLFSSDKRVCYGRWGREMSELTKLRVQVEI